MCWCRRSGGFEKSVLEHEFVVTTSHIAAITALQLVAQWWSWYVYSISADYIYIYIQARIKGVVATLEISTRTLALELGRAVGHD
jgi:hypothetical protein